MSAVNDPTGILDHTEEEFLDFLRPFLTNADRHQRHVQLIVEAYAAARLGRMALRLYGPTFRLFRPLIRYGAAKRQAELLAKLRDLEGVLNTTVQPGVITVDVLPPRSLATHADWLSQGAHLELIQVKVAVRPNEGTDPRSLSVSLAVADDEVRFVDHYPATEFTELGTREVQLSNEGKFVEGTAMGAKITGTVGVTGAKVGSEISGSASTETTTTRMESHKLSFTPTVRKVISSAVGSEAHWEVLATHQDVPIGGHDFFASILVNGQARAVPVSIEIRARFDGWGDLRVDHRAEVPVTATRPEP